MLDTHARMRAGAPRLRTYASVQICHRHHWSVHEGGWQLVRTAGREVLAIPPAHPYKSWARAPDGPTAR